MVRQVCTSMRSTLTVAVLSVSLLGPAAARDQLLAGTRQEPFRVDVNLVTIDAIPRTRDGQFVSTLTKSDFSVLEDAVPQEVVSLVQVHGGRVFNLAGPPSPGPANVPEGVLLPTATRPADDTPGRIIVVVVDDLHFTAHDTPYVRELLKKFTKSLIHQGDMYALFSTGPSAIEIPVTYNRVLFEEAIGRIAGRGMTVRDVMDAAEGSQGPQGLRYNAHVAFSTAYRLITRLADVRDRRKSLVLISNGYDFDPFPQGRTGQDQVFGGRFGTPFGNADPETGDRFLLLGQATNRFADADLAAELVSLTGAANRANATIYTIDPRGVAGTTDVVNQVDPSEMRTHISKTQSSLRLLADATGGFAVVNDNDYDGALKRIDAETSDYYVLGYYSSNADTSMRTRRIEVTVAREDVEVRSRTWYTTRTAALPPR